MDGNHEERSKITQLLLAWSGGDGSAADAVLNTVYERIRQLAARHLRSESGQLLLQPTELANELVINLLDAQTHWSNRAHFFRTVAVAMRNILADLGRRQASAKRGGGQVRISLRAAEGFATPGGDDSSDLYRALTELRTADARKADVIELTYLVGLNVEEVADVVGVSIPTVNRDLRFGRLWLKHRLQS